jgi:hypothetical protein
MKAIDENIKKININITSIHISYHGECHYNSVRRKDDNDIDGEMPLIINLNIDKVNQSVGEKERNLEKNQLLLEEIVSTSCPWKSLDFIKKSLEFNNFNSDAAIEFIISNPNYSFEINNDIDNDIDNIYIENNSNININSIIEKKDDKKDNKNNKINLISSNKKNSKQILSRKELRKLEKNKNNNNKSNINNKIDFDNDESININQIYL